MQVRILRSPQGESFPWNELIPDFDSNNGRDIDMEMRDVEIAKTAISLRAEGVPEISPHGLPGSNRRAPAAAAILTSEPFGGFANRNRNRI
jgi:hypothetical protein